LGDLREGDLLEGVGIVRKIILKWISSKWECEGMEGIDLA